MSTQQVDWVRWLPHVAVSDIGMRRSNNQDAYLMMLAPDLERWFERGHLFVVADGMGAHAAGELASRLAADSLGHSYLKQSGSPPEALLQAVRQANDVVHQRGQMNAEFHKMGTTCSSLLILPQGALVAHVGDSRVYRLRQGKLEQLTFDHSLQWEMRALARTREEENVSGIPKNVITRSLGPNPQVQVDLEGPYPLQQGDTFLLCSDGLTGPVSDEELAGILHYLPPQEAAELLVDLANVRGGPDNITVVVTAVADDEMIRLGSSAEPLYIGTSPAPPPPSLHPALWIAMGVGLLLAAGLAIAGQVGLACLGLLVALVAGGVALVQTLFPAVTKRLLGNQRWGKGPYQQIAVPPADDLIAAIRVACQDAANALGRTDLVFQESLRPASDRPSATTAVRELARAAHQLVHPAPN